MFNWNSRAGLFQYQDIGTIVQRGTSVSRELSKLLIMRRVIPALDSRQQDEIQEST